MVSAMNDSNTVKTTTVTQLTPAEMNAIKYIRDHTVVTPSVLKSIK